MSAGCEDCRPRSLTHTAPSYRRALWIVSALNFAMGLAEIVGSFVVRSQALNADALDFVGDGAITSLGLIAIRHTPHWRARSAMLQSLFLAAMGIGVLVTTTYRFLVRQTPVAEAMGLFGIVALLVNLVAALILMPHRQGDANVRAIWFFSRNDALANLAIILAAVFVAWTKTPWPDLGVAVIVAVLFLHSAMAIFNDSHRELKKVANGGSKRA